MNTCYIYTHISHSESFIYLFMLLLRVFGVGFGGVLTGAIGGIWEVFARILEELVAVSMGVEFNENYMK